MKKKLNRLLALALAVMMAASALPVVGVRAEEDDVVIAEWTITDKQEKSGIFSDQMSDISVDVTGTMSYSSNRYGGSGWEKDKGFHFSTPTTGYGTLTVSGKVRASATGPASVQLRGKVGEEWVPLGNSISIGNTSSTHTQPFSVKIEGSQMDNLEKADFWLAVDTEKSGKGENIGSGGNLYIEGGITITGVSTAPLEKVTTPTATLASESTVFQGKTVIFSCKPEGSTIMYSTTGPDSYDWQTLEDGKLTLNEVGTQTYYVKGTNEELPDSDVATFTYTVKADTPETIAAAKAGEDNELFKVKGVVTMVDGKNIYIQDNTGGICAFFGTAPSGIELGNTITVTGNKTEYSGLPELENAEFTKETTDTIELTPVVKTIAELSTDNICEYVELKGVIVTEITSGSNGHITVKDPADEEKTVQIFKPKYDGVVVGDTIDVKAAIGIYNKGPQLRNTKADEITVTEYAAPATPTADPAEGAVANGTVVTVTSATAGATIEQSTDYEEKTDAATWTTVEGGKLTVDGEVGAEVKFCVRAKRMAGGEAKYSEVVTLTYTVKAAEEKPEPTGETWVKVTEAPADGDWSGTYLIVHEDGENAQIFDGSRTNSTDSELDHALNYAPSELNGDEITHDDTVSVTLKKLAGGGYTIKTASGWYIYHSGSKNSLNTTQVEADAESNPLTVELGADNNNVTISSGDYKLQFFSSGDGSRFRFYSKDQKPIALYKLDESDGSLRSGTYVIWNPANNVAMSGEKKDYYQKSTSVQLSGSELTGYTNSDIWTVNKLGNGNYTFTYSGQKLAMTNDKYTSFTWDAENSEWTLVEAEEGVYYLQNAGRTVCYIEYSSFKTFDANGEQKEAEPDRYKFSFYPAKAIEEPEPEVPEESGYEPKAGDEVVIFNPNGGVVMTGTASGTRLKGAEAKEGGGKLFMADGTDYLLLTVGGTEDAYTFTSTDNKVLSTAESGNTLTLSDAESAVNSTWKLEKVSGGYIIRSVGANYNGNHNQAIEYYTDGNFNTYGYKDDNDSKFVMRFYTEANIGKKLATNTDIEDTIAQWGGGGPYDDGQKTEVKGDLYKTGDMLDAGAKFTVRAKGAEAQPYQTSTSTTTGSTSYYMGGTGIGSGNNDYMLFELSSLGYGDMKLSFRLRVSNSGPGSYALQYSVDGESYSNFESGSYHYGYTTWAQNDEGVSVPTSHTADGKITDGKAMASMNPGEYIEFTFDVPVAAENAQNLYIKMVPSDTKANGKTGTPDVGNTTRIDSVKLVGSPIVDDSLPGYVTAEPDGQEEDVPAGTEIALTASNTSSTVKYRFVNLDGTGKDGEWLTETPVKLPDTLPIALEIKAVNGDAEGPVRRLIYQAGTVEAVKMSPNGGGVYLGADGTAKIVLTTNTFGAEIWYRTSTMKTDADGDGNIDFVKYENPIELKTGFGTLTVDAYATKTGLQDSAVITRTFTERGQAKYELYFGQMHSHTSYSDGSGSPQEAFDHVMGLSQDEYNMDFLSLTDHSNSFDDAGGTKTINDTREGKEWNDGKALAASVTQTDKFVGIFGYEMTWSNGLGHINTFNTTGFQDRTQSAYTTYSTALQNYYEMLKTAPDSISQFNHPGTTFGDFSDFAHYDAEIDQLITLIEVGNGEGAIGSSGYFPSYEYYTRALDKGWHVAPTNNQDNHKGGWGSANNARDVVLVDELTEAAIYDAMRNYRVYATEDINLEIYYTFDGNIMGSRLEKSDVSDTATIRLELNDPNAADQAEATVQVIVNGGKVAEEVTTTLDNKTVEIKVPTTYNYYYIKVVEADGDIAVTAPVWVGAVTAVGVTSFEPASAITITGEEQTIDLELYNNEKKGFAVSSITYTDITGIELSDTEGIAKAEVIGRDTTISEIKRLNTASTQFKYTFTKDGIYTIRVTVTGTLDGVEMSFYKDMEITVMPAALVQNIIVDGTHYNDYVTGYYGGNMGNMTAIAANNAVQVTVVTDEITPEMLENCSLLVLSAPARTGGTANAGSYSASSYTPEFIEMVKDYVSKGGSVVVCGLADYQDKGADKGAEGHIAAQQNKLLEAIGSSMRINDDEVYDTVNNGGQAYRLYPSVFNSESEWTNDIVDGQTYSQYSGCSVNPGNGTWLVKGFDTTLSVDSDRDGVGATTEKFVDGDYTYDIVTPKGQVYFLAYEQVGAGNVFAAGGVFLSDFEVKAELDNIWDLPYANRTIFENILHNLCVTKDVTDIADTRTAELNKIFTVEGYVTAGRENPNNAFFDAIYIQDDTGGTCVFPYSTDGLKLGTKVRVLGYTDAYQGDREIQVISLTVLNDAPVKQDPKSVTTAQAADYGTLGGQLLKVSGTVSRVIMASGRISQFDLTDSSGTKCTVFIDGYIWDANGNDPITGKLQAGATATAVGLSYLHPEGDSEESVCVLRVRDCGEITFTAVEDEDEDETPNVTTDDKTENGKTTTETTAKPDAVVSGGKASSSVSSAMGAEIVDQARKNGSDTVTIAPEVKKDVDSASVTIPGGTVKSIGERTDADLKVETPVGDVTIPNEALAELGSGGRVTVSAERTGDSVSVEITSGGETVESVPGGIRAALPLEDGQVAVLVDADGNETIIPKSVVEDGVTYVMLDGSATVKVVDNSVEFEDVSDGDWFVGSVDFAASHGLVNGVGKASFAPGSDMTRAMLATVLWRLESEADAEGTGAFADVKSGLWYSEGVAWAGENGVINGTGNGNFEPERAVTRQEMAVMMYNYARFAGLDTTVGADLAAFGDGAEVDSWAKDAMAWAVAVGLIRGTGAGLEPDATATRAQVVTVMERLVGLMVK